MKEKILEIVGNATQQTVSESDTLSELGLDSLDVVELAMALEEEFVIEIDDETLEHVVTVQDVINAVEALK